MTSYPTFGTPPEALADLRTRTGWTAARANRWLRDVNRYGRRSPQFDADRFVGLLREAKHAGATTHVLGPAIGEGDVTVARWIRGSKRPRPTTDPWYAKPLCSVRGCSNPRRGNKDVCRDHDRAEYNARPEVVERSAEYRAEYEADMRARQCRMPHCNQIAGARRGWCRSHDGELGHDNMTKRFGVAEVRRRSAPAIAGKVTKDSDVAVGNLVFKSPSAAACHALNAGSADGWLRWRVPRLGGKPLAELRDAS